MVAVLLAAAVVSALLGDLADTVAIVAIVLLNALLGFTQEYRAEKAMAAVYAHPLQGIFRTGPLIPRTLALCAAAGAALFLALEGRKFVIALARGRSLD